MQKAYEPYFKAAPDTFLSGSEPYKHKTLEEEDDGYEKYDNVHFLKQVQYSLATQRFHVEEGDVDGERRWGR